MCNALSKGRFRSKFDIGMELVEITGYATEIDDIGLRHRSAYGREFVTDMKVIEVLSRNPCLHSSAPYASGGYQRKIL
jgi:hypothetical protein